MIDSIVRGEEKGGYYLVIGPKGTGKGTMILSTRPFFIYQLLADVVRSAMRKINADGVSFCEGMLNNMVCMTVN